LPEVLACPVEARFYGADIGLRYGRGFLQGQAFVFEKNYGFALERRKRLDGCRDGESSVKRKIIRGPQRNFIIQG
jgi:hypothetical protein